MEKGKKNNKQARVTLWRNVCTVCIFVEPMVPETQQAVFKWRQAGACHMGISISKVCVLTGLGGRDVVTPTRGWAVQVPQLSTETMWVVHSPPADSLSTFLKEESILSTYPNVHGMYKKKQKQKTLPRASSNCLLWEQVHRAVLLHLQSIHSKMPSPHS